MGNKVNLLYITELKNNAPRINELDKLLRKFNIFCLTLEDTEIKIWEYASNHFEIFDKISYLKEIPNFHNLNKFYEQLFEKLDIDMLFLRFFDKFKFLRNAQEIIPLCFADSKDIPIFYGRNSNYFLNNTINLSDFNYDYQKIDFSKEKGVVYTAIFGNYEELIDPKFINDNLDYICFTDNPNLKSDIWKIKVIDDLDVDNTRKARNLKILPHKYLKEYDFSLWVDAGFQIIGDLERYLNIYLKNSPLLIVKHSERDCIYNEGRICARVGKDDPNIINQQMDKYKNEGFPEDVGLVESGVLFRRHNDDAIIKVMEEWYDEILHHSKRDQLSFNYVCWKNNFSFDYADLFYWKNPFFEHFYHQKLNNIDYPLELDYIRIFIISYGDLISLNKSINYINSINHNIKISVLSNTDLNVGFKRNVEYFKFNGSNGYLKLINDLITCYNENFIYIIGEGDLIYYSSFKNLIQIYNSSNIDNVAAIIFDDEVVSNNGDSTYNFKPGFSPDLYLEHDYIHNSVILNRNLLSSHGCFDIHLPNSYIRDIILKLYDFNYEIIKEDSVGLRINHISPCPSKENELLIKNVLKRRNCNFEINSEGNVIKPIYDAENKKVSIIIPFKDQSEVTKRCVESILDKTIYSNFEIILINNNSYDDSTKIFLNSLNNNSKIKIFNYSDSFNYSKINNFATSKIDGDIYLFLNNDTEIISGDWLNYLVGDAIQDGVGAIGAKLYYPDLETVQHAGVGIGLTHLAAHYFMIKKEEEIPDLFNKYRRNMSAVTGACLAVKKEVFDEVNGFNEHFEIAFSDVELCLKIMERGYRNIYNPHVKLIHHEMKTRGKKEFRDIDRILFYNLSKKYLTDGDPFINKNISLNSSKLDKIRTEDEIPYYLKFWNNFSNELNEYNSKLNHIVDGNNVNYISNFDISHEDIIHNQILMDNFFKNPKLQLNNLIWFFPSLSDLQKNKFYHLFDLLNYLSINEKSTHTFVIKDIINIEYLKNIIKNKFPNLIFKIKSYDEELPECDAAFCTHWTTAYDLLKYNKCVCKFYFIQEYNQYASSYFEQTLINQTFNFDFIGITYSEFIKQEYQRYNRNIEKFKPLIDVHKLPQPSLKESNIKKIIFFIDSLDSYSFKFGIDILKIVKDFFKDSIQIFSTGVDFNTDEYGLTGIVENLGVLNSEDLKKSCSECDVGFVLSYDSNNLIFEYLELMTWGCAIVTNNNILNKDFLINKENAILIDSNITFAADEFIRLLNEDALRNRIIKNGYNYINNFNYLNEIKKFITFLKSYKLNVPENSKSFNDNCCWDYDELNNLLDKLDKLVIRNGILTKSKLDIYNEKIELTKELDEAKLKYLMISEDVSVLNGELSRVKLENDSLSEDVSVLNGELSRVKLDEIYINQRLLRLNRELTIKNDLLLNNNRRDNVVLKNLIKENSELKDKLNKFNRNFNFKNIFR